MSDEKLKDSGDRVEYSTGSHAEPNNGRGRYDLISPIGLKALAIRYELGASKYAPRDWELGEPLSRHLNSAQRHLEQYKEGDRSEDHLAAVSFHTFAIQHVKEMIKRKKLPKELDDLPDYMPRRKRR